MIYIIKDNSVVVITEHYRAELSKKNFSYEILSESILEELSFSDLKEIWDALYGIPGNIKDILIKKLELYSSSHNINSFIYKDKECWLDKNNRNSLWNLSNSSLGNVEFIVGDEILTMSSIKLKAFLVKLEVYAYKCFVNTFKHLKVVKSLDNIQDIINYDYTTGYPEKIVLE